MKPALRNSLLSTFLFDDDFSINSLLREPVFPAVNVQEEDGLYHLEVIAPGLKKEDFKLALNDTTLTISAENKTESEERKYTYRRKEYSYRSFRRSFDLPESIEPASIQASYTDGVLNIEMKKKAVQPKIEPKLIPIA